MCSIGNIFIIRPTAFCCLVQFSCFQQVQCAMVESLLKTIFERRRAGGGICKKVPVQKQVVFFLKLVSLNSSLDVSSLRNGRRMCWSLRYKGIYFKNIEGFIVCFFFSFKFIENDLILYTRLIYPQQVPSLYKTNQLITTY